MMNVLDYSQYDLFQDCEWKWYERYVSQYQKRPKQGQKDDARTLGSLVHTGLQTLRETGKPIVGPEAVIKYDPTPECLQVATQLLVGYTQAYPTEQWTRFYCEEVLGFHLCSTVKGIAKVDSYFKLDEEQVIESGLDLPGSDRFTLTPGVWIYEYKTKDPSKSIGNYVEGWKINMQADFQIHALQATLNEPVQGIFVNVLEKAKAYTPKRSCKTCGKQYELRDWLPTGAGFACPVCGNVQQLDTADKSKAPRKPAYYRLKVTRSERELEKSLEEMRGVAIQMEELRVGLYSPIRATRRCVDSIWGPCEYYSAHVNLLNAAQQPSNFVKVEALSYL